MGAIYIGLHVHRPKSMVKFSGGGGGGIPKKFAANFSNIYGFRQNNSQGF